MTDERRRRGPGPRRRQRVRPRRVADGDAVVFGSRSVTEAIRAGAVTEVLVARGARATSGLRDMLDAARVADIPVRRVGVDELDRLAPRGEHHGVVAVAAPSAVRGRELGERDLAVFPFELDAIAVVLDGITDPQNLGAAARSAEAAGASMLVTRTPRAAGVTTAAIRASAGALLHLPHARVANVARAIDRLQEAGFFVAGLDAGAEGTIYDEPCPRGRVAIVVGSEGVGMSRLVRQRCDALVALPMRGRVGSLNAAASLAAALYGYVVPSRMP